MYRTYFSLKDKPFELVPDSENVFFSESHKKGYSMLKYGVLTDTKFLMLTGGVGTGKTTLVNALIDDMQATHQTCLVTNPRLSISEFYAYLAGKFQLTFDGGKHAFRLTFAGMLEDNFDAGRQVLLIIDEAHLMPQELLEEIRLLANFADFKKNSLNIFLVGEPELLERLSDNRLLALRQRISQIYHLESLSSEDTVEYVKFRLRAAGGTQEDVFTPKALDRIHLASSGNPRVINILCNNALLRAFSSGHSKVGEFVIKKSFRHYTLTGNVAGPPLKPQEFSLFKHFIPLILAAFAIECAVVWYLTETGYLSAFWRSAKYTFAGNLGLPWGN